MGRCSTPTIPAPGAQRIDVEPTRGVSNSAGRERLGHDVQREHHREIVAEAFKPLTGLDTNELDKRGRRIKLPPGVAAQCDSLDWKIADMEATERAASPGALHAAQRMLLPLRERYRSARC